MKQAIRRQPIEISTKPPRKTSKIFRNTIFGCVVIVALWMIISLLTYHPDDPAWSKTIANPNVNNWMGHRGAFFSDVLLTTIGQAAWFIPLLLIAYAYHLICQQGYKKLDIETVMIRIIGVILVLLTIASLFNIYNPNNDLVERGGAIGKFIGTLLTHSVDWMQALFPDSFVAITASKIILFFLLFITAMMASGCGPLAWIDAIGYSIIRSIHFMISFIGKNNHNSEKNITDPDSDLANIEHLMEKVKNQPISKNKLKKGSLFSVLFKPKEKPAQSNLTELAQAEKTIQVPTSHQKIEPKLSSIPPASEPMATNSNHKTVMLTPKFESQVDEYGEVKIPAIFKKPTIKSEPQNSKEERVQMLSDWVNESNTQQEIKAISSQTSESNSQVQQIVPSEPHQPKERKNSFFSQVGSLFSSQPQTLTKPEPVIQSDDNDFNIFLQSLEKYHSPDQTIKVLENYDNDVPTVTFFNSDNANTQQDSDAVEFPTFEITDTPSLPPVSDITFETPESQEEPSFATFNVEENITITHEGDKPHPSWNFNDWENDEDIEDEAQEEILSFVKQLLVEQPLVKHSPIQPQTVEIKEESISPKKAELLKHFPMAGQLPYLNLLGDPPPTINQYDVVELNDMAQLIEEQLRNFSIRVNVANIEPGPVVTRFELDLAPGVKVAQINNLEKDIARGLSVTSVRVVDIIPGTSYVGLEIPNKKRETVYFKSGLASAEYQAASHPLTLILGKSISGETVLANLAKMPHLLVAGTTGSGKSVGVNTMLLSMLFKASPEELRLILIDPKMLELSVYNDIPHLLTPVVTDMKESANALRWCVAEMERRYLLMSQLKVRNIAGFNQKVQDAIDEGQPIIDPLWRRREHVSDTENPPLLEKLPFIVVVIDEFADMMMLVGKKCEELIARLAQKARASGIHLILATQRPSVDVITGLIKANIPTRIAFQVSSKIDSRTIIDQQGADTLLGHGDMLYVPPGVSVPIRVHGAFVDDHEVNKVVEFLKLTGEPDYIEDILQEPTEAIPGLTPEASGVPASPSDEKDPLFDEAVKLVVESRRASISYIQRRLRVGYQRAARLMEEMEELRIVTPPQPNGNREVLMATENNDDF